MDNLNDSVGGANLFGGSNYSFVPDRFCCQNKAIFFNRGYLQMPSGVYLSGDFSMTAWIYVKSYVIWEKIFYFGNGVNNDSVVFQLYQNTSQIGLTVFNSTSPSNFFAPNSSVIQLNQWYHVAVTLKGTLASIYVNGQFVINGTSKIPRNIVRTTNCIGKSCLEDYTRSAIAIYDELKLYKGALSLNDIKNEYNIGSYNGIIKIFNLKYIFF
jgi:hypothetical protein